MKNVLSEEKNIKFWNKWHFVENKTDYTAYHKNVINILLT